MPTDTFWYKILFLTVIILTAANLALLSLHLSNTAAKGTGADGSVPFAVSKNSLLSSLEVTARAIGQAGKKTGIGITNSAAQTIHFVGHAASATTTFAVHSTVSSVAFMSRGVGQLASAVPKAATANPLVKPTNQTKAPEITSIPAAPIVTSPVTAAAAPVPAPQPLSVPPQWPLHGRVTTYFGANDLPYERYHTGIDITDGSSSPIKPFRPGRVIEAIRSYAGLGNHVVLDNGNGITSVYGHLRAITVAVGQQVDESNVIGYEGSTGASTGTHLHFEIRMNGQPVDPRRFITGLP